MIVLQEALALIAHETTYFFESMINFVYEWKALQTQLFRTPLSGVEQKYMIVCH